MSIDPSLKIKSRLQKIRSVLTRVERIEQMKNNDKWSDEMSVVGLPKTKVIRVTIGKKKKEKKAEEGDDKDKKGAKGAAKPAAAAAAPAKKK